MPTGPRGDADGVRVGVAVLVGTLVAVAVAVGVDVGVAVAAVVGVEVGVFVGADVGVLVGVAVGVFVGVFVGPMTTRHCGVMEFAMFPTTFVDEFVNSAGPGQLGFDWPGAFVTFTVTTQELLAGTWTTDTVMVPLPAVAVVAAAALAQVPPTDGGFCTTRPDGSVSVNVGDSSTPFGFVSEKMSVEVPP